MVKGTFKSQSWQNWRQHEGKANKQKSPLEFRVIIIVVLTLKINPGQIIYSQSEINYKFGMALNGNNTTSLKYTN